MSEAFERAAAQLADAASRGVGGYVTVGHQIDGGAPGCHVLLTVQVPSVGTRLMLEQARALLREALEANRSGGDGPPRRAYDGNGQMRLDVGRGERT